MAKESETSEPAPEKKEEPKKQALAEKKEVKADDKKSNKTAAAQKKAVKKDDKKNATAAAHV